LILLKMCLFLQHILYRVDAKKVENDEV